MDSAAHTSKNPLVRRFRAAADGSTEGRMLAEGTRLVREALDAGMRIVEAAWSPRLQTRSDGPALLERLRERGIELHECSDRLLARCSHLDTHQGIAVILERPRVSIVDLLGASPDDALVLVAAGIRDPGNLGALLRSAEAAGASGVVAVGGADPFREKALRGSAGSAFRLPCVGCEEPAAAVRALHDAGLRLLVAERDGETPLWDADLRGPVALVVGSEGAGVPEAFTAAAAARIAIPLADPVESLNVAVAAGVLLFEARRQRR